VNWQRLSDIHGQPSKGIFAKLELRRVELLLREMSPEELRAALDEIAALGVDSREQWALNQLVLTAHAAKDPVGLLDHLTNSERTSGMSGNSCSTFSQNGRTRMPQPPVHGSMEKSPQGPSTRRHCPVRTTIGRTWKRRC
jgi:hypothetical protein